MKKFVKNVALATAIWTLAEMTTQYRLDSKGLSFPKYVRMYATTQVSLTVQTYKRNHTLSSNGDLKGAYMATINDLKPMK